MLKKRDVKTLLRVGNKIAAARLRKRMRLITVEFALTYRCNLQCGYCAQVHAEEFRHIKAHDLSFDQVRQVMDNLDFLGVERVNISGGEPLLREDIDDIITIAAKKKFFLTLVTNGMFVYKHLKALKLVDLLSISLDGTEQTNDYFRGKGSFGLTFKGIHAAHEENIPFVLSAVVTAKFTREDINFLLELCEQLNVQCAIVPMISFGICADQIKEVKQFKNVVANAYVIKDMFSYLRVHRLRRFLIGGDYWCKAVIDYYSNNNKKQKRCMAGCLFFNIKANGTVTACSLSADSLFAAKAYEHDFLDSCSGKIPSFNCLRCLCFSYYVLNCMADGELRTLWTMFRS
ncbi:MAG: radical SAM protein [Candidatus Omnitrophica bacterium]|nr:radical SAM protein [Candidatus Omnitrophota bacterium]